MKEIGGYFELELAIKDEYHPHAIKLSSGRNGFKYLLKAQNVKKVYIPTFICNSIIEPLEELEISYEFYNVNQDFEIIKNISLELGEKLLYVNYFGLKNTYVSDLSQRFTNSLIIDNTHAFFEKPLKNTDTLYSARKFFGVSDGGYLYTENRLSEQLDSDESCEYTSQLMGRVDKSASAFYHNYQEAEQRLANQSLKSMSKLTSKILKSVDYEAVKIKRERNFYYLHSQLKDMNHLEIDTKSLSVPFVYPLIQNDITLREKLIVNKIYIAKYWTEVLERDEVSHVEIDFVNKIIPLPIDQRYDLNDMKRICEVIKGGI